MVFENGIALNCSEAKLFDEFLLQVFHNELDGTNGEGFLFGGGKVFGLTNIGLKTDKLAANSLKMENQTYHEGNDIVALLNEPFEDDT